MDEPTDTVDNSVTIQFDGIITSLSTFRTQITALQHQLRVLEKSVTKEFKTLQKDANKKKSKGNRKPSGFAKPSPISKELCIFMKLPENSEVPRTEATQYIIKYIAEHKLQHVENRKIIVPNTELKSLLSLSDETTLTYFNIQKYMNNHFEKK